MDEVVKSPLSPLVRGKPAWHVRYRRLIWLYVFGNAILLAGQFMVFQRFGFGGTESTIYSIGMVPWVFGFQIWLARWLKGYGVSFWRFKSMLSETEGIPCPSCLYPLCKLQEADGDFVCSECGCGVNGVDAIRAWDGLRGYRSPQAWNRWLNKD